MKYYFITYQASRRGGIRGKSTRNQVIEWVGRL
mgnify:CR=1 FL=1